MIKTVTYRVRTDRNTDTQKHTQTDRKVKSEGPKILSNDIVFLKTTTIGGHGRNAIRPDWPLARGPEGLGASKGPHIYRNQRLCAYINS